MKEELLVDKGNGKVYYYYDKDGNIKDVVRDNDVFKELIVKDMKVIPWNIINIKKGTKILKCSLCSHTYTTTCR